jgi:hypothetical protein
VSRSVGGRGTNSTPSEWRQHSAADQWLWTLVRAPHGSGPRATGELIRDVPNIGPVVVAKLKAFATLDPVVVAAFGARDWVGPAAVVRLAGGGR